VIRAVLRSPLAGTELVCQCGSLVAEGRRGFMDGEAEFSVGKRQIERIGLSVASVLVLASELFCTK